MFVRSTASGSGMGTRVAYPDTLRLPRIETTNWSPPFESPPFQTVKPFVGRTIGDQTGPISAIFLQDIRKTAEHTWDRYRNTVPWLNTVQTCHSVHAFNYEYDIRSFRGAKSRPTLSESISASRLLRIARRLLQCIIRENIIRRDHGLIFFGHGFGGLICEQALVLAASDSQFEAILDRTVAVVLFGTPHTLAGLGEWAILTARENNIDAAPTPQKQDWAESYKDLRDIADMQREFQSLVDDDAVLFQVVCCFAKFPTHFQHSVDDEQPALLVSCFGMLHIRIPWRSKKSKLIISPEWSIVPGSRVIGISDHHFGMTQPDNAAERRAIWDLLGQASRAELDEGRGQHRVPPSQPPGACPSRSTTHTQYDLEYWLIRRETFASEPPRVGDIVRLVAESTVGPVKVDRQTRAKLGSISFTNEIHKLGRVEVEANATMEIGADKSYRLVKRAAQEELFPTSYEILRLWKAFAKRKFPWRNLKYANIRVDMWQAHEEALDAARFLSGRNEQPGELPDAFPLTVLASRGTYVDYVDVESSQNPNGATVVVQTVSYTKKGHARGSGPNEYTLGGGPAIPRSGSEITFAVKVARPRPVIPT